MKIAQIDLYELKVPPIPVVARYLPDIFNLTICRICTDEGLVGVGEVSLNPPGLEDRAASYLGQSLLMSETLN